jgi:chromosome segregation ATPase
MAPDDRGLVRGLENAIEALQEQLQFANTSLIAERQRVDELLHQLADAPERGPGPDPLTAIAIQTLSQAVAMLREDVDHERDRAAQAERQVEEGRKRIDELQATLVEERRRIDGLYAELGDARTVAMISGCEAAVLRTRLELLTERRPWWRRWFR